MTAAAVMSLIIALLKAAPTVFSFLSALNADAEKAKERGLGYDAAVADGVKRAHEGLMAATAATNAAAERHRQNPDSDAAFDNEFQRKD